MNFDQSYNSEHSHEQKASQPSQTWKNPRAGKENQNKLNSYPQSSQSEPGQKRPAETKPV